MAEMDSASKWTHRKILNSPPPRHTKSTATLYMEQHTDKNLVDCQSDPCTWRKQEENHIQAVRKGRGTVSPSSPCHAHCKCSAAPRGERLPYWTGQTQNVPIITTVPSDITAVGQCLVLPFYPCFTFLKDMVCPFPGFSFFFFSQLH